MTYSEKMLLAIDNEDLAEAQLMFQRALHGDAQDVLEDLAEELLHRGFLAESQEILEQLLAATPEKAELHIPLAEIAIENDEVNTAFEHLEQIDSENDSYPESLVVAADLYQIIGIPEVSEAKLNEAKQLLPEEPLIDFALGELYFSTDQFVKALSCYEALADQDVAEISGVLINERIGLSLGRLGEFEESLPYLEAALEEEVTDNRLFQLAYTYLQIKDNQKAIHYFQELRLFNPQYQALYLSLAEVLQEEELLEEAQEVVESGIKEDPYQVDLLHFASENAFRLHDIAASEKFLLQALELPEKNEETLLTLSNLYLSQERYEDTISTLKELQDDENPYVHWNLAQAMNALEEYDTAAEHYQEAYQGLQHEPDLLKEYAIFLREDGQLQGAGKLFRLYLQQVPEDLEVVSILEDLESGGEDDY